MRERRLASYDFFKKPAIHSKPTISIGQALLILLDTYKNDPGKGSQLKELYLCGAVDKTAGDGIKKHLKDPALIPYHVSPNAYITDADPARRYFETHLAYHTLKQQLGKISEDDLQAYYHFVLQKMPEKASGLEYFFTASLEKLIKLADQKKLTLETLPKEYNEAIRKLSTNGYLQFSDEEKEKLIWLIKGSYASITLNHEQTLPLAIYNTGIFSPEHRGRISKIGKNDKHQQKKAQSRHLGLMKSYMPVPVGDLATSDENFPYLKSVDEYRFDPTSTWAQHNFTKLVHPFSCSISGSLLAQLRTMLYLKEDGLFELQDPSTFKFHISCYIAFMLYHTGGHSLHEYTQLFRLSGVQEEFDFLPELKSFNETYLFLQGNEMAFNQALAEAIEYNNVLLARKTMQWELTHPSIRTLK